MAQLCPVCRTRLWTDPLFTPRRLHCPRCGAEFKPTVSWFYFRVLLLVVATLGFVLVALLTRGNLWILIFLAGLVIFLFQLPRLIDLQRIGPELNPSEGVLEPRQLDLELEDLRAHAAGEKYQERRRFYLMLYLLLGVVVALSFALVIWQIF